MRVLVCGSRDLDCRGLVHLQLNALLEEGVQYEQQLVVIEGGCPTGADFYAHEWVKIQRKRNPNWIVHEHFPADWAKYGKRAGFLRNTQMLEEGKPDIVLAFVSCPDGVLISKGTGMMVSIARKAGVPCFIINEVE